MLVFSSPRTTDSDADDVFGQADLFSNASNAGGLSARSLNSPAGLAIDQSVKLPQSTHVEIRYRNLLGLRVVNLDPGAGTGPYLSAGDLVPATQTEGPLDLDTIFNNLKPLLTGINPSDINALSEALVQAIAPHKADIDQVLSDTSKLLGTLSTKDAQIGSLIDNLGTISTAVADQRVQLEQLLSNLATLADTLSADSGQLDRVLINLNTATGELALDGTVVPIGAVKQKAIGAKEAGVDVFLVPAGSNAREARKYAGGLKIIPVKSFPQALLELATLPLKGRMNG